jgi:hypothetical protein
MKIRLWKLGVIDQNNINASMLPTKVALEKFRDMLQAAIESGNDTDIIWGPDINVELVEIDETVKNFIVGPDGKMVEV